MPWVVLIRCQKVDHENSWSQTWKCKLMSLKKLYFFCYFFGLLNSKKRENSSRYIVFFSLIGYSSVIALVLVCDFMLDTHAVRICTHIQCTDKASVQNTFTYIYSYWYAHTHMVCFIGWFCSICIRYHLMASRLICCYALWTVSYEWLPYANAVRISFCKLLNIKLHSLLSSSNNNIVISIEIQYFGIIPCSICLVQGP
jgi:hypothetical protein